jgi:hypothetical protein
LDNAYKSNADWFKGGLFHKLFWGEGMETWGVATFSGRLYSNYRVWKSQLHTQIPYLPTWIIFVWRYR